LTPAQKARTLIRIDAGGGRQEDIRTLVSPGYQALGKEYSGLGPEQFAALVEEWAPDPRQPGREIGWAPLVLYQAGRPVRRIAARCQRKNGQWVYGVRITTLDDLDVLRLRGLAAAIADDPAKMLCAYVYLDDQRGGAIEVSFKEENQGLRGHQRAKKRFPSQQLVVDLRAEAHNTEIWARRWLAPATPRLAAYGIKRWVRDSWSISGLVELTAHGQVVHIVLNHIRPLTRHIRPALADLLGSARVEVTCGGAKWVS
jgi:hypothetical protein